MKIAILTLPLNSNYGGNLQCYALVTILKRIGHEVTIINLVKDIKLPPIKDRPYLYFKRFINKILRKSNRCIFTEQKMIKDHNIVHKFTNEFITKYIPLTPHQYKDAVSLEELTLHNYDAFIVGSDQVWRPKYAFPDINTFFFSFLKKNQVSLRISYAASFGTNVNEYSEQETNDCRVLIKQFDAVSVREDSAIQLIQKELVWDCPPPLHVLDPTMLLEKDEFLKINSSIIQQTHQGELFYYILDMNADKKNLINNICKIKNIQSFTVSPKNSYVGSKPENKIIPPVEEWLQGFNKSEIVVTDSFHGCIFSIIFNKSFIVYANPKRGIARFHTLLKMFNLENRLITDSTDFNNSFFDIPIDWNSVNAIIGKKKQESINFLQKALKK